MLCGSFGTKRLGVAGAFLPTLVRQQTAPCEEQAAAAQTALGTQLGSRSILGVSLGPVANTGVSPLMGPAPCRHGEGLWGAAATLPSPCIGFSLPFWLQRQPATFS